MSWTCFQISLTSMAHERLQKILNELQFFLSQMHFSESESRGYFILYDCVEVTKERQVRPHTLKAREIQSLCEFSSGKKSWREKSTREWETFRVTRDFNIIFHIIKIALTDTHSQKRILHKISETDKSVRI